MSVLERLAQLLVSRFGISADELRDDVTFAELDLDSLSLVEFAMVAEKEFGVPVGEDELSPQDTLAAAVALIGARVVNA
ncbi:MAG TPA: phosphopantetheine-binding protein [Actinophytocola sp.]|uniref:phosphopantetheine-binding protein n=1 Tax=Actinophytocola sp. TaxID=1872138 RepID=UPI002DDD83F3|nr:phosphopantetheine-binding protein [Actinophytocola sp.]HEV2779907.1 phosphopantetheine-binding protein [Actinophytocola sp.]